MVKYIYIQNIQLAFIVQTYITSTSYKTLLTSFTCDDGKHPSRVFSRLEFSVQHIYIYISIGEMGEVEGGVNECTSLIQYST